MKNCTRCGGSFRLADFHPDKRSTTGVASWCKACHRNHAVQYRASLREEALRAYGGVCVCCGESWLPFLVVDHIEGDGNKHRRSLGGGKRASGGVTVYRWLKKSGWPSGFQVLCANCNMAKERGGCPPSHGGFNETR